MATAAEVAQFRRSLAALSTRARQDLAGLWATVAGADIADQRRLLSEVWPDLIATYGDLGVTVAADMLDEWLPSPDLVMVDPVDTDRALARMRWALGTPEAYGNLQVLLDELVKQPARSTIVKTADKSGARWARVPTGDETCSFCLMLASRGAVYSSAESAGREGRSIASTRETHKVWGGATMTLSGSDPKVGRKFHGDCDCAVIAVASPADLPAGYHPDVLYDQYLKARDAAGSGSQKKILAAMRENEGIH